MSKIAVLWSGGKDALMALEALERDPGWEPAALLTTFTAPAERVSMHQVKAGLIQQQADALGLPLQRMYIPEQAGNDQYEQAFAEAAWQLRAAGIRHLAAGDLFLEDVRRYREALIGRAGMESVFPLWKRDTSALLEAFIARGHRALTVCIQTEALPAAFLGRSLDETFVRDLPPEADPCGERGEFHTFVWDGPLFSRPLAFHTGEPYFQKLGGMRFGFLPLREEQSDGQEG